MNTRLPLAGVQGGASWKVMTLKLNVLIKEELKHAFYFTNSLRRYIGQTPAQLARAALKRDELRNLVFS